MDVSALLNQPFNKKNVQIHQTTNEQAFHDILTHKNSLLDPAKSIQAAQAANQSHKNLLKKTNELSTIKSKEDPEEDILDLTIKKIEKKLSTLAEIERRQHNI